MLRSFSLSVSAALKLPPPPAGEMGSACFWVHASIVNKSASAADVRRMLKAFSAPRCLVRDAQSRARRRLIDQGTVEKGHQHLGFVQLIRRHAEWVLIDHDKITSLSDFDRSRLGLAIHLVYGAPDVRAAMSVPKSNVNWAASLAGCCRRDLST